MKKFLIIIFIIFVIISQLYAEDTYIVVETALANKLYNIADLELKKIKNKDEQYYIYKGKILLGLGKIEEFCQIVQEGLNKFQELSELQYGNAVCFLYKNNLNKALYHIQKALELMPSNPEYNKTASIIHALNNDKKLAEDYIIAAYSIDKNPLTALSFAYILGWNEKYEEAKNLLMKYFSLDKVYYVLGLIYEANGDLENAILYYKLTLALNRDFVPAKNKIKSIVGQ